MTDFTFFVSLKLHMRFTTLLTKDIGIFLKKIKGTFFLINQIKVFLEA